MADSILRLKVESSEYDAKLKKAAEGIRHLAEVAHRSGGELTGLEKAEIDYIRSLGEMETKSRSAAGKVRELESTFKELKVIYDQLNDVEKADEGGKALAASLEQIKQRAQEARAQLDSASKSLNDNGQQAQQSSGILDALASKFTINVDALKLFDVGLKAAGVALDVAKDAFLSSETNVDDWGRTIASAEGIYNSFLQSLNSGNFSDFLNNIGQVTQAARDAYNALDELGTRMTIINPERAKLQARQQELRATIRRNGQDSDVGKAALAELKQIEPKLSQSFKTESQMNRKAFESLVKQRLAEGGINLDQKSFRQFMSTFSSDAAFRRLRNNARGSITQEVVTGQAYNPNAVRATRIIDSRNTEQKLLDLFTDEWRKANSGYLTAAYNAQGAAASNALGNSRYLKEKGGGSSSGSVRSASKSTQEENDDFVEINGLIGEAQERVADLQKRIRESWDEGEITELKNKLKDAQKELKRLQDLGSEPILTTGISGFNEQTMQAWMQMQQGALSKSEFGSTEYSNIMSNIVDMNTIKTLLEESIKTGIDVAELDLAPLWEKIFNGDNIPDEVWEKLQEKINEKLKEMGINPIDINFKTGGIGHTEGNNKSNSELSELKYLKGIQGATSAMGNLMEGMSTGLKQLGFDVPEGLDDVLSGIKGIMTIINSIVGFVSAIAALLAVKSTPVIGWLLAQGGVVRAAQGFGTEVPGTSYSGDNIPALLNSGETVLTKAQSANIAGMLENSPLQNLHLEAAVSGNELKWVLNNDSMVRGGGVLSYK